MAVGRVKTWIANEILTASDLNDEFDNILNTGHLIGFPRTANADFDGFTLILDDDGDTTLRSPETGGVDDIIIALGGTDVYQLLATHMTINGKRVLTTSDRSETRNLLARIGMMEARVSGIADAFTMTQLNNF